MRYVVRRTPSTGNVVRNFDSLFDSFWNNWGVPQTKSPSVDIWEDENAYVLEAELPGYSEKDIDVHVDKHVLKISSITEAEKEEKEETVSPNYLIRERYCSSFERSFTLPDGVDEDNIAGEFKNGILTLTIPKVPASQPKKIDVKLS
ncbi:MAG: Hsp20/alpha crystallin family protein [Sphaerochaetaceae bacterium]|nr:Hsp20/alpha crystallin family protein [Sphaerochaetaceae bacterium]